MLRSFHQCKQDQPLPLPNCTQMSKLQLLAQKRKLEKSVQNENTTHTPSSSPTGLSRLLQSRNITTTSNPRNHSSLNSLLAKKRSLVTEVPSQPLEKRPEVPKTLKSSETPEAGTANLVDREGAAPAGGPKETRAPDFFARFGGGPRIHGFSLIQPTSSHVLSNTVFHNFGRDREECSANMPNLKRRKCNDGETVAKHFTNVNTNLTFDLAEKITTNFKNPSPDDKRKVVDSLTEKVSQVDLDNDAQDREKIVKKKSQPVTKPKTKIDIQQELERKASKPLLSSIVIGHVDSGKSTTIGRLLYDLGIVDSRTLHKLTRDAEIAGKGSFSLAWVMDQTPEERSRGVTIDIVQTQFETENMRFAIIDSPGHRDYVPQMINGVTQADLAVVIIDATSDLIFEASLSNINAESSLSEISKGQTFEQLTIARNLGIKKVVVAVNKMDAINWDENRFISIKDTLVNHLTEKLDFEAKNLEFVPTSGFNGDNIVSKSKECPWYKGLTLFETLEKSNMDTHKSLNELTSDAKDPFALTVTDITYGSIETGSISSKKSDQITIHGRVNSGIIQPGESVKIWPSGEMGQIDSVTTTISQVSSRASNSKAGANNAKTTEKIAIAGEFVEMKIRKVDLPDAICLGDVVTKITHDSDTNYNVDCTTRLLCELQMFGLTRPVLVGTPFVLFRGNVSFAARLAQIDWVEARIENEIDGTVTYKKYKKRKHVSSNQRCRVVVETEKLIPLINLTDSTLSAENGDGITSLEKLNRIVLRKEGMTVGAGVIRSSAE